MPFETLKCSQCGAVPKEGGTRFCGFCGSMLPVQTPANALPVAAPERFDAVQSHPDLPALLELTPEDPGAPSLVPGGCLLVMAGAIGVFILSQITGGNLPPGLLLVPALVGSLGLAVWLYANRERTAPIHRNVAVVLDERVRVGGGGKHSSASTHYYVLIADRAGTRVELEAEEDLAGRTAPGDIGVAYIRRGRLVDFTVVRT